MQFGLSVRKWRVRTTDGDTLTGMDPQDRRLHRALDARDARFDGVFFVGVTSTGIYCRPICPAQDAEGGQLPLLRHRRSRREQAGFRPCLRCRPELAPGNAPVDDAQRIAQLIVQRLEEGSLDERRRPRGDRRPVRAELPPDPPHRPEGARRVADPAAADPPAAARQAAADRDGAADHGGRASPAASPACAASTTPSAAATACRRRVCAARRRRRGAAIGRSTTRRRCSSPTARPTTGRHPDVPRRPRPGRCRARHATAPTPAPCASATRKGWIRVTQARAKHALLLEFTHTLTPVLPALLRRVRALFDLDARPDLIATHLAGPARWPRRSRPIPGLRVPGAFDGFELGVRAILGQQVTVKAATTIACRFVEAVRRADRHAVPGAHRLTPAPAACRRVHRRRRSPVSASSPRAQEHHRAGAGARVRRAEPRRRHASRPGRHHPPARGATRHRSVDGALHRHACPPLAGRRSRKRTSRCATTSAASRRRRRRRSRRRGGRGEATR